jgi:NADPH2:quinone reductase
MRAIQVTAFGGPEVLQPADLPEPRPGPGELAIAVRRAGVNYADTHQAEDSYLVPSRLPFVPGGEVAGHTADGRRVVALVSGGGYAERAVASEAATFEVPDQVDEGQALALVLQGTTAWHLLRTSAKLAPGESVVVHAAAGGVGSLAVQLAKRLGAGRVIALASSEEKRALARRLGADAAVDSRAEDLAAQILDANGGEPVDVVLEMAGGATFDACLEALAPFGRLVTFGLATRQPNSVRNADLMRTSRAVVGFWLVHLFRRPDELRSGIAELLGAVAAGELEVVIGGTYPLSAARRALEDIAARRTEGKLLLDPAA